MKEPEIRCPTQEAIESLVERFCFRYNGYMQDWEYEVADYSRIDEFIEVYKSNELSDDEKFTLMETIIQSFEESETILEYNEKWLVVLDQLQQNFKLHQYSIWYWSCFDNKNMDELWFVSPFMRDLYLKNGK